MALNTNPKSKYIGYYRYYPNITLGKGNFSTVCLARHKIVKCDVALKIINTDDITEDYVHRNLHREEKIMRTLHHPNIIQLYEVVKEGNLYCLSMELVRGVNLFEYMTGQPNRSIPENLSRYFFYQMLSAVEYMHNINIIHRDLKLENILVEHDSIIKIAVHGRTLKSNRTIRTRIRTLFHLVNIDTFVKNKIEERNLQEFLDKFKNFGLSNVYYPSIEMRTHCGSLEYAAPELFFSSAYGPAIDVWSLGVILYTMIIGKMPFVFGLNKDKYVQNTRKRQLFVQRISKGLTQDNWELMENLTSDCWDILHKMLEPDQFRRFRIGDVITHPWIAKDRYLAKVLPQTREDLQRKFHPEIMEYLAYKLHTTVDRIDAHIHVYRDDNIAAMYRMVRITLIKEVMHPLKAFEKSFLYRFRCWRETPKPQHFQQTCDNQRLDGRQIKDNFTHARSTVILKNSSVDDGDFKVQSKTFESKLTNLKLQTRCGVNAPIFRQFPVEHCVKTARHCISEDIYNKNKNVKEQEITRSPYRSYRDSRPTNVGFSKNSHREIANNNHCVDEMAETLSNLTLAQKKCNTLVKENLAQDCQNSYQNNPKTESKIEKKIPVRDYRELTPRMSIAERNKTKYTSYTDTKVLANKSAEETSKPYHTKTLTKTNCSVNQIPTMQKLNSFPKKIEILKRVEKNAGTRDIIPKATDETSVGLQTSKRQPLYRSTKVEERSKHVYQNTPSRIPVKSVRCGPSTSSQPYVALVRKARKKSELNGGINLGRGDTRENTK